MLKNGNIRNFFKPAPRASQGSQSSRDSQLAQSQPQSGAQPHTSLPPHPSTPILPSSSPPRQETPPHRPSYTRDMEIKGSDDDDDDDDSDGFEDLHDIIHGRALRDQPVPAKELHPCETPKAKRTALTPLSTPLTIRQQKRHKYDMKALVRDAKVDDATRAATQAALFKDKDAKPRKDVSAALQEQVTDFINEADDEVGKERLRRAIQRTDLTSQRHQWYFFRDNFHASSSSRGLFPVDAAVGRWQFLGDPKMRQKYFEDGFVQQVLLRRGAGLPDDIFLWILDELPLEPSGRLRSRYVGILALCTEQSRRLLHPDQVSRLFQKLGSRWESIDLATSLERMPAIDNPYPDRTWSHLRSVLRLLSRTAGAMNTESATCAMKLLLRLGIDDMVMENVDVLIDYQAALQQLTEAILGSAWDDFCEEVGACLYRSTRESHLRWRPLACMPTCTPRSHDLRRRLASVFLFDDLARAREHPEDYVDIRAVTERLDADDFAVYKNTDYHQLAAISRFLDVVIDDGSRETRESAEAQKLFDSEVDELIKRVDAIGGRVNAAPGAKQGPRIDSKKTLQSIQHRLTYSVRTKKPPKTCIFDGAKSRDDEAGPRQTTVHRFFARNARPVSTT